MGQTNTNSMISANQGNDAVSGSSFMSFNKEFDSRAASGTESQMKIEDFDLLKVVGRGNFGKVYLAQRKTNRKIYAIKSLKKDFIDQHNQTAQVKIERDIMQ